MTTTEQKDKLALETPEELQEWREKLMDRSPRIANKLRTLMRIENKLMKRLYSQTYTSHEDPNTVDTKRNKATNPNNAPTKTLSEINKFTTTNDIDNEDDNAGSEEIAEEDMDNIHDHIHHFQDSKYEIVFERDEELGFDISAGNEGVYVSRINEKGKEKQISLYSSLSAINNQNVTLFDLNQLKRALANLSRPARITFRKSIVQTPYGTANIINRNTASGKVLVGLEYATAYLDEEQISRFTYNKNWNEFEETRLFDLISDFQAQFKKSRSGFRSRNRTRNGQRNKDKTNGNNNSSTVNSRPQTSMTLNSRPQTSISRVGTASNVNGQIPWDTIAEEMHNRSAKDCEKRWELINTLNHLVSEDVLYNKLSYHTRKGDYQSVKRIIQRNPELLLRPDKNRSTPLFTACWYGKCDIAKLMIDYGAKVNHSNLKGNYPIHMAVENSYVDIVNLLIANDAKINLNYVYNLIDNKDAYNVDPAIVLAVNRAQLQIGDKVWYQHDKLGLIPAVIMEKLSGSRPVQYIIKMRINQYHETAIQNGSAGNINKIMRISILDKCLKPVTESSGPPLKELINKKTKMLERFHKWDSFWNEYNDEQQRISDEILETHRSRANLNENIDTKIVTIKDVNAKIEIVTSHKIGMEPEENDTDDVSEIEEETNSTQQKENETENSNENESDSTSNSQTDTSSDDKSNKTQNTIKPKEPFCPTVIHNNYYLTQLRHVPIANRCVGLRKLQTAIAQHPDTKEHQYEQEKLASNNNDPSKKLCYVAREHVRRFDIVMEKLIDYVKIPNNDK